LVIVAKPRGSYLSGKYWIDVHDDVRFLKDGKRCLWLSERSGFNHLYLYANDGSSVKQLTSGEWEIRNLRGVNEDSGRVFFVSNEVSPLEAHLYSITLNGAGKRRLDYGSGTHAVSMSPGGRYYPDTESSLVSPPRSALHSSDGTDLGVFREADRKQMEEKSPHLNRAVPSMKKGGNISYIGEIADSAGSGSAAH